VGNSYYKDSHLLQRRAQELEAAETELKAAPPQDPPWTTQVITLLALVPAFKAATRFLDQWIRNGSPQFLAPAGIPVSISKSLFLSA
jgi:hypothetical protein